MTRKKHAVLFLVLVVLTLTGCDWLLIFCPVSESEAAEALDVTYRTAFTAILLEYGGTDLPGFTLTDTVATFSSFDLTEIWDPLLYGYTTMDGTVTEAPNGDDTYDISLDGGPVRKIMFTMTAEVGAAYILDDPYSIDVTANARNFTLTEADKPEW
jgi:hypothetical protein